MATDKPRKRDDKEIEQRPAGRKDAGVGNADVGAVDGIGGAGGSSGTGSVREKVNNIGDVSGIDAAEDENVPVPGSIGKGKAGSRSQQMNDGGLSGKTRGDDSETMPNQTDNARENT